MSRPRMMKSHSSLPMRLPFKRQPFPKLAGSSFLGNGAAQPIRGINDSYSLVLVFRLIRAGNQHLGIGIFYRKQRRHFALEGFLLRYVVRDLNVKFLTLPDRNKIDLFFIENADVDLVTSTQELYSHDVLKHATIVHVLGAETSKAKSLVDKVELVF